MIRYMMVQRVIKFDPTIGDDHIQWSHFHSFPILPVVLGALIGGFLVLDR